MLNTSFWLLLFKQGVFPSPKFSDKFLYERAIPYLKDLPVQAAFDPDTADFVDVPASDSSYIHCALEALRYTIVIYPRYLYRIDLNITARTLSAFVAHDQVHREDFWRRRDSRSAHANPRQMAMDGRAARKLVEDPGSQSRGD